MFWRRKRRSAPRSDTGDLRRDTRLPDGDTVLRPGAVRWTTLYRSERARTDAQPLMTPLAERRAPDIRHRRLP
jgi:hypothetical protein